MKYIYFREVFLEGEVGDFGYVLKPAFPHPTSKVDWLFCFYLSEKHEVSLVSM